CNRICNIAYSCHTLIIQKKLLFTIKFTLNFFFSPLMNLALLPVLLSAFVLKFPLKVLFVIADYLGIY
ncbi:hypothetical protein DK853_44110, partial [Klebsiella oxytoca]